LYFCFAWFGTKKLACYNAYNHVSLEGVQTVGWNYERSANFNLDTRSIGSQLALIFILILVNGLLAMTEMAIVSSRKTRLEKLANDGDSGAQAALQLAEEPNQLLSTIQVGITLIGIFNGAFGGATLSKELAEYMRTVPVLAPYSDALSLALVVTVITYLSLILGELVPKRLALNNPEPIAARVARPMRMFARLAAPVVYLLSASTDLVLRLLRVRPSTEPPVTEEEINILIGQGMEAGTFEKAEQDMVQRIFRLGDQRVDDLMTPRTQMVWLDTEDPVQSTIKIITESAHSRFPVARGGLDDLVGIVYTRDLLSDNLVGLVCSGTHPPDLANSLIDLEKCVRAPLYVPKTMRAFQVLELFKQSGRHEALVLDEYGGILGFVTLHDVLEEIVGDMPLMDESDEPLAVQREDGSWLLDGMLPIDEFKELFHIDELPEEDDDDYRTLGGFATSFLGHIPLAAETFTWRTLKFEIVDMDRVRVDKVLVTIMNS